MRFHINRLRGQAIVTQGAAADGFYLLQEGAAAAYVDWDDGERGAQRLELCRYGPGDFFGERGLLTGAGRLASVVSVGPSVVCRVERAAFFRLLAGLGPVLQARYDVALPMAARR
jgi:CRP-like cAMP-binding protein